MSTFHGLQIYEILENGNLLIGPFINTPKLSRPQPLYDIDNEIARKKEYDDAGVEGQYTCRYIQTTPSPNTVIHCDLKITKHREVYEFEWSTPKDGIFFKGIGMKVGHSHVAVSYTNHT